MTSLAAMQDFARAHVAGRDLQTDAFPHDLWRAMGEAGLFRIGLRQEFGGAGGGYRAIAEAEKALVAEGGSLGFGLSWTGHQLTALWFVDGFASDAQRQQYLPLLASGELTASVAISEPGIGAHPKHLKATARRDGEAFVIDGEKAFVTNGPIADLFVVLAITSTDEGRNRFSAFLVPRDTPGFSVVASRPLGFLRPSPHCQLKLESCRVPAAALLGTEGTAFERMSLRFRDVEDGVAAGGMLGIVDHLLRRIGKSVAAEPPAETLAVLGELAALQALAAPLLAAVVDPLDGKGRNAEAAAQLVGLRLTVQRMLALIEGLDIAAAEGLAAIVTDLRGSLNIARGPRAIRQARLGSDLIARSRVHA
ncbi:MAG: acyl-CoA dehydrogenase family protein [Reyranellaceae bacterium]